MTSHSQPLQQCIERRNSFGQKKAQSRYVDREVWSALFLVHADNIVLVDSLASNDTPHGVTLLQYAAQLLLLALKLHLTLLQLTLQALLVALQSRTAVASRANWASVWQQPDNV